MDMWDNALSINNMQFMRIQEHPIQIKDSLIVIDNLEGGRIRLYEQTGGPVNIQQLICGNEERCKNAMLVAEIIINDSWQGENVFIHKISCEYGYEQLITPMIDQVLHFAYFYGGYESVMISDTEFEKWMPHAKDVLIDFQRVNRVYEYRLDGKGAG